MTANGAALAPSARRTALRRGFASVCAVLACVLVAAQAPAGVRAPVVIVFLCVVPGMALVGLVKSDSLAIELSLSIALSVAVSGLTAGVLVYAHLWSPTAVVLIVAAISLAGGLQDVELGRYVRIVAAHLGRPLQALPGGRRRVAAAGLPVAIFTAELARRAAGLPSGAFAAIPRLARRAVAALVAFCKPLRPARRPRRASAAARARRATAHRSRRERPAARPTPASPSPLQGFLLDELRRRTGTPDRRRRRAPRSLAHLQPHELADLLSWSSLQRYVTQRAIREIDPELWFVDDLERRLGRRTLVSPGGPAGRTSPAPPRGVWITGVSAHTSIPVAWRMLEDDEKAKEWRTRLALEMIDSLPELGLGGAVVAAGTTYGSLSGFRRGLEARGLPYLLRVDPVTAAREFVPDRATSSAAEARQVLQEQIAAGAPTSAGVQPTGAAEEPVPVVVQGEEHLLLCEVRPTVRAGAFWLSNLPATTAPGRLTSLIRLANRSSVKRPAPDLLLGALEAQAEGAAGLDRELALVALAGGLRTLDPTAGPVKGAVEA